MSAPKTSASRVIVGIDGSAGSRAALGWAICEAQLRGLELHAVCGWQFHPRWTDPGPGRRLASGSVGQPGSPSGLPDSLAADVEISTGRLGSAEPAAHGWLEAEAAVLSMMATTIAQAVEETSLDGPSITSEAAEGHPAAVLIGLAGNADLLVVGTRGHGGVEGTLLGSVSQRLVSHARCPVVVVPAKS